VHGWRQLLKGSSAPPAAPRGIAVSSRSVTVCDSSLTSLRCHARCREQLYGPSRHPPSDTLPDSPHQRLQRRRLQRNQCIVNSRGNRKPTTIHLAGHPDSRSGEEAGKLARIELSTWKGLSGCCQKISASSPTCFPRSLFLTAACNCPDCPCRSKVAPALLIKRCDRSLAYRAYTHLHSRAGSLCPQDHRKEW